MSSDKVVEDDLRQLLKKGPASHERILPDPRIEPTTVWIPSERASDRATGTGIVFWSAVLRAFEKLCNSIQVHVSYWSTIRFSSGVVVWFARGSGFESVISWTNLIKKSEFVVGRPFGSVAGLCEMLARCTRKHMCKSWLRHTPFPTPVTFWFLADSRTDLNNDVDFVHRWFIWQKSYTVCEGPWVSKWNSIVSTGVIRIPLLGCAVDGAD